MEEYSNESGNNIKRRAGSESNRRRRPASAGDSNPRRRPRPEGTSGNEPRRRSRPEGATTDAKRTGTRPPTTGTSELARRRESAARARRARELKKKKQRRKVITILIVALMLIIGAGIGGAYALGLFVNPLDAGTEQLQSGSYQEAIATFEKATDDKDKAAQAYQGIGMANWELKEYKACKDAYTKALEAGAKESGTIYNLMALCDMQLEDYDAALSNITAALDSDGNSEALIQELKYNEIVVYEKKLDWENAKTKMAAYIAEYPDDETAAREAQFLETR